MIFSNRTTDQLLENSIAGPSFKIESQNLNMYYRKPSQDSIVIDLNCKQEQKNIEQFSMHGSKQMKFSISPGRPSFCTYVKTGQSVFKTLKNRVLVERFKNNLLSTAQILNSVQQTSIKAYENYLLEKLGNSSQRELLYQSEFTQKLFRFIVVIVRIFYNNFNIDRLNQIIAQFIRQKKQYYYSWEFFSLSMQLFKLWYCPFIISFGLHDHFLKGIEIFIVFVILIDSNLTRIYNSLESLENISENSSRKTNILSSLMDLLRAVCWMLIYQEFYRIEILRELIFFVITLTVLYTIKQKYEKQVEILFLKGINLDLLDLFTLIITILFFAHYISCLWHYIGDITLENYGSWFQIYEIQNQSVLIKYNYSFYWATTTITTVGYGDITPKNQIEFLFTTIIMMVSSCMFAYSLNSIGLIVNNMYQQNLKQKRSLALLNTYMKTKQINKQLQIRVRNYLKFSTEKDVIENYEATQNLINSLPQGLKNELKSNIRENVIKNITLFQNQFSQATNLQLSSILTRANFTPQDVVYHRGDQNERCIYFIASGEVKLIEEKSQRLLRVAKAGQIFGEYQFFTNLHPKDAALCTQFAELYKIDREQFLKVLQQNSKDFQRFHNIKDSIMFKQDYSIFKQQCLTCSQICHPSIDCPLTQHIPNIYIKILKSNYNCNNDRDSFKRGRTKFQALNYRDVVVITVNQFQENFDFFKYYSILDLYDTSQKASSNLKSLQLDETFGGVSQKCPSSKSIKNKEQISITRFHQNQLIDQSHKEVFPNQKKRTTLIQQKNQQLELLHENYFSNSLTDFDKLQIYSEYQPYNNITNILKIIQLNIIKKKKTSFQRKVKLKKGMTSFV